MGRLAAFAVVVGAVALQGVSAQHCSPVCEACCPRGDGGEWLRPNADGDCVGRSGVAQCRLGRGKCTGGKAAAVCERVHHASVTLYKPGMDSDPPANVWVQEGMPGWSVTKAVGGALQNFPPYFLNGMVAHVGDHVVPKGTDVDFYCPEEAHGYCDAVVLMYECSPCRTQTGGLPALLAAADFERSRCGPTFTTGMRGGHQHRLTVWRKRVEAGHRVRFQTEGDAEWVAFAISHGSSLDCADDFETREGCELPSNGGICAWKGGRCELNRCVTFGPARGCDPATCVGNELPGVDVDSGVDMVRPDEMK
eukprot:TRINITY_DN12_c0_g1_i1.p2 TRINITY_DN12_c0_g1~~TRINITY_DN12_c0_g1_i1.p2  ORF type:complete len:308 (+),score=113.23 TRINITY_DN12_c0_g1_i1:114-1037(+)